MTESASCGIFYLYRAIRPLRLTLYYPQWNIDPHRVLWWLPLLAAMTVRPRKMRNCGHALAAAGTGSLIAVAVQNLHCE